MGGLIPFQFPRDGVWLKSRVSYIRTEDACGVVAMNEQGKQIGAAIFDNWLHSSVQITLVIESMRAVKWGLIDFAADFVFRIHGKKHCYAWVAAHNEPSLRLCKRVGFKHVFTVPDGYADGIDLLGLDLTADALNLKSRKVRKADA